jgi:two-component system, NarL family, nitrate/nitrite response regulator NarL
MGSRIRVGVVDEHPLFRDGIVYNLESQSDIEIVGQGSTARDAIQIAQERQPDVLVIDIGIPGGGMRAIEEIALAHPTVMILMLTAMVDDEQVCSALKRGARGCLAKGTTSRELVQTVRTLSQGEHYVSPGIAARLLMRTGITKPAPEVHSDRFSDLTQREEQILSILIEGRSNKEIGNKLDLSEKTIKHHVTNILQKLQVRNRVEAAILASDRTPRRLTALPRMGGRTSGQFA